VSGEKIAGAGWVERGGTWYPSEKAADFMEEFTAELTEAGWKPVGDLTMRKISNPNQAVKYLLEAKVEKNISMKDIKPKHVCGKAGFGVGPDGYTDVCPACDQDREEIKRLLDAKDDN